MSVKTSVIMTTPDFGKRKSSSSPLETGTESPEIIKKDKIRDPVIEINTESVTNTPSGSITDQKMVTSEEKVKLNPFLMDEAMSSLIDVSQRFLDGASSRES